MREALFPSGLVGVIFDCDGVMIESRAANTIFYNKVLSALGLPPMTAEQEQYSFMASAREALWHMVPPQLHGQIADVVSHDVVYERDIVPLLRLQPGFRDFVSLLHGKGVRMAIHTNRTLQGMQTVLDFFSLPSYFSPVVGADTAAPKPSPEGTISICRAWQCAPSQVLFVGDTEHDQVTAQGAGVVFAAMGTRGLEGRLAVADFAELATALADSLP